MNRQRKVPRQRLARALGTELPGQFRMPPKHPECGKRRCATEKQAVAYVLYLARKSKDPLRTYECPACSGWHVTKLATWTDPNGA